jgi:hypothetical protein
MSTAELEPVVPPKSPRRKLDLRRRAYRLQRRVINVYQAFMEAPKDVRITGFQFLCFLAGLYFVSWWSIPVAGVIGAVIAIIAAERQ